MSLNIPAGPRIPLGRDHNPGGARWCETHQRLECTKNRTKGRGLCHKPATRGCDSCDNHAGTTREISRIQGEGRITAWTPHGVADKPISAPMAVLGVLQMSWLRLAAISELLRRQVALERELSGDPGEEDEPKASGFIGFRYGAAGRDGVVYVQSEEMRALVALEAAERDRVVKYAKVAHDMGISDKLLGLAERWGDVVAGRIALVLEGLGLSPEQNALVPGLLTAHLSSIDIEAMGSPGA